MNSVCLTNVHDVALVLVTYSSHVVFKIKVDNLWKIWSQTILSLIIWPRFRKQLGGYRGTWKIPSPGKTVRYIQRFGIDGVRYSEGQLYAQYRVTFEILEFAKACLMFPAPCRQHSRGVVTWYRAVICMLTGLPYLRNVPCKRCFICVSRSLWH